MGGGGVCFHQGPPGKVGATSGKAWNTRLNWGFFLQEMGGAWRVPGRGVKLAASPEDHRRRMARAQRQRKN